MSSPTKIRARRLRKTKAQLIDEIDWFERQIAATETASRSGAPVRAKASDHYLANQALIDLAKFPSENPNPVLRVMPDGTVLYANDSAIAVKRLLKGRRKSILARDVAEVCGAASRAAKVQEVEFRSDDHVFASSIAPVPGETYINIYGRDVTDGHNTRVALEAAYDASAAAEARLKAVIDNFPSTICLKDAKGRYQLVNKHFADIHGTTAEAMLGKTAHELFSKAIADPFRSHDRRVLRTGIAEEREQVVTTPGGPRIFSEIKFPITANGSRNTTTAIGLIATDITERKRAEEALRESEERFRELFEAAPFSIVLQDWSGAKTLIDKLRRRGVKNFRRYFQKHPEFLQQASDACEIIDLNSATLKNYGAADKPGLIAALTEKTAKEPPASWAERLAMLAEGASRASAEDKAYRLDGSEFDVRMTCQVPPAYRDSWKRVLVTDENITERKRAERDLAEKEAQLRLAMDNMLGGIVINDKDLNNVLFNGRYSELFDYPDGLLKVGGSVLDELRFQADRGDFGPGDKDDLIAAMVATYRAGEGASYEREIAGSGRTVQIYGAPTPGGGWVSFVTDITDRKRAEAELAEKEAQLRLALDNMPGGMELVDRDLNYVIFNAQYSELHDYPNGLLKIGGSVLDETRFQAERGDYAPGVPDKLMEEAHVPFRSGKPESYERTLPSGRTLNFNFAPTPDGGYVTIATDITERKRAEETLAEKEAQLHLALDNMQGGIRLVDKDQNYVFFNQQYLDLYDFPEGLLKVGDSIRVENLYSAQRGDLGPGDPETLTDEWLVDWTGATEPTSWERAIAGSGQTLQVCLAPTPEGGYVSIVTDITERKRVEEALIEAKRRAEEAGKLVSEKNRMLESLSNQLSKYLSPQVYASIFSGEQSVEIASKRKKLTVFFSDIADFTGVTDSLEPEELTNLLNHYLTEMSKIALDFGATIDKYVGDAIIAFFGDPESRGAKEDARACVNMAIAMQRRMRELQSEWLDSGLEQPFELRMGINTGFCTVGNFGSAERMDYTIIGNEVNLAARLEASAEVGGILLSQATHSLVKDTVMAEEGDALTVKGFARPVRTYSVVGLYDDLAEQGQIIYTEQDGVRVSVDMSKGGRAAAIRALEEALSRLQT